MKSLLGLMTGTLIALTAHGESKVDLMFVVDESGSVDSAEFISEKNFVIGVANGLTFGPTNTAAGIIQWAANARLTLSLTPSKTSFINFVQNNMVKLGGGTTNLEVVLTATTNHMEGAAGRTNANRVIVFISEGSLPDNHAALTAKVDALAARGYHLFPIGGFVNSDAFLSSLARNGGGFYTTNQINEVIAAIQALSGITNTNGPTALPAAIYPAVEIGWLTQVNKNYQVQWASELDTNQWFNLGSVVVGNGSNKFLLDSTRNVPRRFYRVQETP